ncbi:MAG: VOC family protein [Oligoflexia bacterium]|nr:MAG: VOC family protein [Oligoflexia bacterium]
MARTSTYLNFVGNTEKAFLFYQSVFGGEFMGHIARFSEMPAKEGAPVLSVQEKNLVMHVALPITGGHLLMGTDAPESMGFKVNFGNNVYINLEPDTRTEAKRLFDALSKDGKIEAPLQDMFWGAYYGALKDQFGVQWMVHCTSKE